MKRNKMMIYMIVRNLLIILLAGSFSGCYYYKVNTMQTPDKQVLNAAKLEGKYVVIHLGEKAWHLDSIMLTGESILGVKKSLDPSHLKYLTTKTSRANRYRKPPNVDETSVLKEVHLYCSDTIQVGSQSGNSISVPFSQIAWVEFYEKAKGKTFISWFLPGLGVTVVVGLVAALIAVTAVDNGLDNMHIK